jgi:hypothetical protein
MRNACDDITVSSILKERERESSNQPCPASLPHDSREESYEITLKAIVEKGDPHSGLKNVMSKNKLVSVSPSTNLEAPMQKFDPCLSI